MQDRQRVGLLLSAAVLFIVGFLLVMNDSGAGWVFIILGITYLGASTRLGQTWVVSNPKLERWGLIGVTLLIVVLVVIVGATLLLK